MEQLDVIKRLIKKFPKDMEFVTNVNGKKRAILELIFLNCYKLSVINLSKIC